MLQMETVLIIDALKYHLHIDWDIQVLCMVFVCLYPYLLSLEGSELFTTKQTKKILETWLGWE